MNNVLNFLIWSSANPNKISLSIKAGIPFAIAVFAMLHLNVDINPIADQFILVVNTALMLISGAVTLYGLLRKALSLVN